MGPVLCLVTDRRLWGPDWPTRLVAQVTEAAQAGVHLIQVREPGLDGGTLCDLVERCVEAVRSTRARIIVNDRLDVALIAGAHGVHLKGDSMPEARVRAMCPRPFLIGRSIHTVEEASRADAAALDYLMFGTVFTSASKPGRPPAGVGALASAIQATLLPVLGVGGVTLETLPAVMTAGAAGAAAIGLFASDTGRVARRLAAMSPRIDTLAEGS